MEAQQDFNEALLKLCILLYQVDGKVTLSEQDYFEAIQNNIEWHGEQDLIDFQTKSILQIRNIIETKDQRRFVNSLKDALSFDAKKALAVASGISYIDGEIADEELEILDYLQNRVLAKSLC
jgi:tellurite resistance protein